MRRVDVAVVGGGPAGAAAAIELARAGLDVAVLDRATFPRDKCCGDGLTASALRGLDRLGLDPGAVASWQPVDGCVLRSPSGREVTLPLPERYAAVARRSELDAALLDVARSAGAKVFEGRAVDAAAWSGEGVTLATSGGEPVAARYAIGADGMWSPLRRALGLAEPGYLGEWHAFRQYVRVSAPADRAMRVWFDADLLPGYAWSFPLADARANVGYGVLRGATAAGAPRSGAPRSGAAMAARWRALLAEPHVRAALGEAAAPDGPVRAWPIPARLPDAVVTGAAGRVLFAGDAARAADPLTGEGIGQALETGMDAAAAVLAAGPRRPEVAAARYRRRIASGLAVDHRLAAGLSRVLAVPAGARAAIRLAGATGAGRREFARWLFEDYPRAALVTPGRWRAGRAAGVGPPR